MNVLQEYPDVLCLVARFLNFKTWKRMRLVCKQFASWLKPYKKLMQQRMCKTAEIHCIFFLFDEPFRGAYRSQDQFAVTHGERVHYLAFNPSMIWNELFPTSKGSPRLFSIMPGDPGELTKIDLPSKCEGRFGETWNFYISSNSSNIGTISGRVSLNFYKIKILLDGVNIASYTITAAV